MIFDTDLGTCTLKSYHESGTLMGSRSQGEWPVTSAPGGYGHAAAHGTGASHDTERVPTTLFSTAGAAFVDEMKNVAVTVPFEPIAGLLPHVPAMFTNTS